MSDREDLEEKTPNSTVARFSRGAALLGLTASLAACPANVLYGAPIDDDDSANSSDDDDAATDDDDSGA
jgi:hypothetical protein